LAVNTSFSRVRSRKRHEKRAPGHSLLHNLIALASMVWFTTLDMQLGALHDQRHLRESCFLKMFVCRRLWNVAVSLQRRKQPKVTARRARLGPKRGGHGAGCCLPPRARSLEPCAAKCSKKSVACETSRRAYTPPNAPGRARAISPRVYVRQPPGALVPVTPCAHATARSAWPFAGTSISGGVMDGAGGLKTAQAAIYETQAPSPGV